jgi:2-polyprenyl-6-methoxyphenol hydroxylase-like FAD-dependent oxidoreductase
VYSARTLTLPDYVVGRVLFAGDAAHLLPIFGVRGANTAFQDAQALGWQLAAVVRGTAGPVLLANYSAERVGAAREIIRRSRQEHALHGAAQPRLPAAARRGAVAVADAGLRAAALPLAHLTRARSPRLDAERRRRRRRAVRSRSAPVMARRCRTSGSTMAASCSTTCAARPPGTSR